MKLLEIFRKHVKNEFGSQKKNMDNNPNIVTIQDRVCDDPLTTGHLPVPPADGRQHSIASSAARFLPLFRLVESGQSAAVGIGLHTHPENDPEGPSHFSAGRNRHCRRRQTLCRLNTGNN